MPDALVELRRGLNVISGASDTGKSYLLGCLRYMLGTQDPPTSIPEDDGYDRLLVEVSQHDDRVFTLERSLKNGGDFSLYGCPLEEVADTSPEARLATHQKGKSNTIPDLLLEIAKLQNVEIRTKADGTKRRLRYSDVRHFSLISETAIIDPRSPVWPSGQYATAPADNSIFNYFLTGEDDSKAIKVPEVKVKQAGWQAKHDLLAKLIEHAEKEAGNPGDDLKDQLEKLVASIEGASNDVARSNEEVRDLLSQRKNHWALIRDSRSRLAVIEQLDKRFVLLKEHYNSDLERLSFLGESDHFLSQLGEGHCPICGQLLGEHTSEQIAQESDYSISIQEASNVEKAKIQKLIEDLDETLQGLTKEAGELERQIENANASIKDVGRRVQEHLEPDLAVAKEELNRLVAKRIEVEQQLDRRERLEYLRSQQVELGKRPTKAQIERESAATPSASLTRERRRFCDTLESRLSVWRFPKVGTVEFEPQKNAVDIVVNGQNRTSRGKGVRALLHAAFTINLMYHARDRHPRMVVLDSPLTSYKDKDRVNVEEDVQLAFYEDMVKTSSEFQIILLENKDPPESLRSEMNYIHFSRNQAVGRYGFYPIKSV
ncbi:MAG: hypothetical protein KDB14_24645 [Planctomycetales bacterium]|nr:hypothetical protein [Planctomycetales bacterium]